ncbi:hypothetical protein baBA2_000541 [Borrelia anserina]|uniref:Uncharacterized protein n=2 Tax=Borrelia anserina TaxID=143 RepID=W5SNR8_BORAN|nr:hypothetical protein [Borrelia anserina]AHH08525.1 Hypothetical protein BAN_0060300 [Borrelia anserina BA2]APR64994.1 hypothetical protein N187_02700 [Borrelia anserina Es]UPA06917.1 hypothetical protein baBA2_000541 [Borrelia anserina]
MSANRILEIYLKDLILELKKLKTILEFEDKEISKGMLDILAITNPAKDIILNSINNYYITTNSWLERQDKIQEEVKQLIKDICFLKEEICIQYQNTYKTLKEIFDQKKTIPKIKFPKNLFDYNIPALVDVKI